MRYALPQLQSIVQIKRHNFHVSKAAQSLNTSQSVLSKHLKSFENAAAVQVFTRSGKRLTGLTEQGLKILHYAERVLDDHQSIERICQEASVTERLSLALATTPTLARYLLANTVKAFTKAHPDVRLHIQVEESDKAVEAVHHGDCDLAIVPIVRSSVSGLVITPLTNWTRVLIGTPDCPIFAEPKITLERIAREPIIAFENPTVSLRETFDRHNLLPNIALTTSNPEVMKAYAALGLGIAVVAKPTFDLVRDAPLISRDVSDIFPGVQIAMVQKTGSYQTLSQRWFIDDLQSNLPG